MIDEKAKYILHEIKGIKRYESIINDLERDMNELNMKIQDIQTPSSPQGNIGVRVESYTSKSSIVNSLLSDEMILISERDEFQRLKEKAELYYLKLKEVCEPYEMEFMDAYIGDMNYNKIRRVFNYEHPYKHAINLVKRLQK